VVNTIIIKNDRFYVIYYQQQVIYTFTNEESFYNTFSIYIPVLRLPFILTLSDSAIPDCKSSNDGLVKICGEDRIIISRDIKNCKSVKIDFISPLSGDISAIYSDFSEINGTNMFHRLKITGHKEKVFADITVLMVKREEISEKIFEPENFKDFKNVRK
ncbi:MAG: hypothetical protein N3B13_10930, partial [Deltaproteobacteria bacterium]|nr:hypothetical protein [Deltaproteobacteria bacterium]